MYFNRSNKFIKPVPVDFEEVRGHIDFPRSLMPAQSIPEVLIRSVWTSFNFLSNEVFTPLLPIGGIVVFDLYKFGDLFPKVIKGIFLINMSIDWTVRPIFDMEKTLASIPYPDQKCNYLSYRVALLSGQAVQALQVTLKVPEYVYIQDTDPLKVALWDSVRRIY